MALAAAVRRPLRPGRRSSCRRSTSCPGAAIEFDRMPVLNVTSFWLFALATSVFSAMNERELRQRRADLEALVELGARARRRQPTRSASRSIVLDGLVERFGFTRGVVLGASRRPGRRPRRPRRRPARRRRRSARRRHRRAPGSGASSLAGPAGSTRARTRCSRAVLPGRPQPAGRADGRRRASRSARSSSSTAIAAVLRRRAAGRVGPRPARRDRRAQPPQCRPPAAASRTSPSATR